MTYCPRCGALLEPDGGCRFDVPEEEAPWLPEGGAAARDRESLLPWARWILHHPDAAPERLAWARRTAGVERDDPAAIPADHPGTVPAVESGTVPAVEHLYAEVNGQRLHVAAAGGGEPILFLHGFPEFWYAWKDQLTELGRTHRAVAVDMRGYNLSSKPPEVKAYALPHLVEDIRALTDRLADHLTDDSLALVGHDWGGVVAWAFAMAHPDRLRRLVIINAPHPAVFRRELRENPAQRQASQYVVALRSPGAEAMLSADGYAALEEAVLREGLERGYMTEEDRAAYRRAWSRPGALTGMLNYYRAADLGPSGLDALAAEVASDSEVPPASEAEPATGDAPAVNVPTLVLWGERDPYLLPGNLQGLNRHVSDLTVRRVPGAGHWIVHERPELVNAAIREFLERR